MRAFRTAAEGKLPVWGEDDCSLWPARWAIAETSVEAELPVYSTREEAEAIVERAGGLVAVWARFAPALGLVARDRMATPSLGDIGIVNTRLHGPAGGIFSAGGVLWRRVDLARGVHGFCPRPAHVLAVWGLPA